jgi:uncharacterized protein YyaL (SSP411 family)
VFDNVIPSSNSVMARNLFRLGVMMDRDDWKNLAQQMTAQLASIIVTEPVYMSNWAIAAMELTEGLDELVIVGDRMEELRKEIHQNYFPLTVSLGALLKSSLPLFENRDANGATKIYVCRNKVCKLPVDNVNDAIKQIHSQ